MLQYELKVAVLTDFGLNYRYLSLPELDPYIANQIIGVDNNVENQLERLIWFLENNGFKYESENAKQLRGIKNIKIYIDRRFWNE